MDYIKSDLPISWIIFIFTYFVIFSIWLLLPKIKKSFPLLLSNIRLVKRNNRYLIRKGIFIHHYYYFGIFYEEKWFKLVDVHKPSDSFSTDDLNIANETYEAIVKDLISRDNREIIIK